MSQAPVLSPTPRITPSVSVPEVPAAPTETAARQPITPPAQVLIEAEKVSVFYGAHEAIKSVSMNIVANTVVAYIGPSGCGKSTFLRSINRLNDLIPGCRVAGTIKIGGQNIYEPRIDLVALRRQVGLVFQ